MAVADVYDALRSERPYKKAMSHEKAIQYLVEQKGILFDPDIIALLPEYEQKFAQIFDEKNGANRCTLVLNYQMEKEQKDTTTP